MHRWSPVSLLVEEEQGGGGLPGPVHTVPALPVLVPTDPGDDSRFPGTPRDAAPR